MRTQFIRSGLLQVSLEDKRGTVIYRPSEIHISTIVERIIAMGFQAEPHSSESLDVELGGISDENIPIAIERISAIAGVRSVVFPLKNDSSRAVIAYDQTQSSPLAIYQKIQSIGYKVQPKLENISRAYLRVQGMHCNSCVMNITQTVEDLPGIHHVKVSFDDQSANILYDASIVPLSMIIDEIKTLDFQVAVAAPSDSDKSKGTPTRTLRRAELELMYRLIADAMLTTHTPLVSGELSRTTCARSSRLIVNVTRV